MIMEGGRCCNCKSEVEGRPKLFGCVQVYLVEGLIIHLQWIFRQEP